MLTKLAQSSFWQSYGVLIARVLMGAMFLMAASFKFMGMAMTAGYIASIGFPMPMLFAWLAAILELLIGLAFITGLCIREAALVAVVYIIFLAFAFHGPSMWSSDQNQFGFFVDHFTTIAGLLYMAAFGPGTKWVLQKFW